MTSIEFIGHSGLALRHGGKLLVCDPWMSRKGSYNASWFQYPQYEGNLEALSSPDVLYISHEHPDHYDPEFLGRIDRSVPVLTGRAHKKRLVSRLRRLGFRTIVELDNFEPFEVAPGFTVKISTPTFHCPPHWFDSCALIEVDGHKIFNLNDCNLALPVADIRAEGIDVLFAQATPAIWYPLVYTTYDEATKRLLAAQRRESAIASFVTAAKALQPRLAIPFAGPPCFFDPELAPFFFGEASMFPTPPVAAGRLAGESTIPGMVMNPGDRLNIGARGTAGEFRLERDPAYEGFDYERDRGAYYARHRAEKERVVADVLAAITPASPGLFERFRRHFLPFLKGHPYFVEHIGIRVLFRVTGAHGGDWVVDFRPEPKAELVYAWDGEPCQYEFEMTSTLIDQVMREELGWEDAFLSLRFKAHRDPDRYNQHLFTLFKMSDSRALAAIQKVETADRAHDTFVLEHEGRRYEVQRWCPHGGSDLSEAEVEGGQIVCPGHHWRFSLGDGVCTNAAGRISVREIEEDDAPKRAKA
ncbi:MAG TPA: MBL fold metallo-hydrolase [Candidatus Binatia bacterium]|jgi:UDP-MurNAc hydroxylase